MNRFFIITAFIASALAFWSCEGEPISVTEVDNPRAEKLVAKYGETVTVTFMSELPWAAEIVMNQNPEEEWAEISQVLGNEGAGKGTVRIRFAKNNGEEERTADLFVSVDGGDPVLTASFVQEAGTGSGTSGMSAYLNEYMHNRLLEEYLWNEDYAELDVNMELSYDKFLFENLTKLGDTNIEDGGYYRDYSASAGDRYIYSYISEVTSTKSIMTKAGELTSTYGTGIGPLFASLFEANTNYVGLTIGYVYPGSPAETAGLRRGDTIYKVGNTRITKSNYQSYMQELFYSPSGTYDIYYARYEANDAEEKYDLVLDNLAKVEAGSYGYNPILFAAILSDSEDAAAKTFNIGYMASESFDSSAQEVLEYQIQQFIDAGITELILDLRYNVGGEVQQSRYLASSIVGRNYDDKIYFKAEFNDGKREEWTFLSGPAENDKLGKAPAMNLNRLWVIISENTASASELIIGGLKGVNFPVHLIGSRSEGKNVGMVVTHEVYNGRRFEFAPITYRGLNAKDEYGPMDGYEPDSGNLLNNQNSSYGDDADNMFPYAFGDWANFDFNMALYNCFCDITGADRPGTGQPPLEIKSSSDEPMVLEVMRPQPSRFGNIIYR